MALEHAVETANEKHLAPWMELRRQYDIEHTPLSPFISIELLRQNHLSVGGFALGLGLLEGLACSFCSEA